MKTMVLQEEEPQPPGAGPEPGAPGEPPPLGHFYGMPHSNLGHEQARYDSHFWTNFGFA
jgi:hypothetical protein